MTNAQLVARKLAALIEYARRARARRPPSAELLAADTERQDALGMALLVAIQEAIDIAFHIVSDERWGTPRSYAEGFELLAKGGVIGLRRSLVSALEGGLGRKLEHSTPAHAWQALVATLLP